MRAMAASHANHGCKSCEPWLRVMRAMAASHVSHGCEPCESTRRAMRVNRRVTQLLKANHFKMGA